MNSKFLRCIAYSLVTIPTELFPGHLQTLVITFFLCYLPYIRIKCGKYALKYGMSSCETDMKRRNCYTHQDIYRENYKFGSTNS